MTRPRFILEQISNPNTNYLIYQNRDRKSIR